MEEKDREQDRKRVGRKWKAGDRSRDGKQRGVKKQEEEIRGKKKSRRERRGMWLMIDHD